MHIINRNFEFPCLLDRFSVPVMASASDVPLEELVRCFSNGFPEVDQIVAPVRKVRPGLFFLGRHCESAEQRAAGVDRGAQRGAVGGPAQLRSRLLAAHWHKLQPASHARVVS